MTPGAPSPGGYNPHTPGSGIEQNSSDWVTTDIQVKVRDTYLDTQVVGQTGVIRSVTVSRILGGGQGPPTMYLLFVFGAMDGILGLIHARLVSYIPNLFYSFSFNFATIMSGMP